MEICDKERQIAQRAAEVAARKYDEKMATLYRAAGIHHLDELQSYLRSMAKRIYEFAESPKGEDVFGPAGIRILEYGSTGGGERYVCVKVGESTAELRYNIYGTKGLYPIHWRPSVLTTATGTLDEAAAALRQLDELIAVVTAYSKVLVDDKAKSLAESEERAEKAAHQLELLEKM